MNNRSDKRKNWQVVIGMETHIQLRTQSKIFSSAPTSFGAQPNTQVHWLDCALPGTLPVANAEVINHSIRLGLAIDAKINQHSIFARKHYFYPDLPKGYQISQFEDPIVEHGKLTINVDGKSTDVEILRAHMEEDAGKLVHDLYTNESAVDLNRAGTPLVEVVTTPCIFSTQEAIAYAKELHNLVKWIGICDGNMQEGSFRCDANVSVRPIDREELGTRCEIKNLNSFRFLEAAINYEIDRQIEVLEEGGVVHQETRLYDPQNNETRSMRSKEDAHDYRYFPDPDLLTIEISDEQIAKISASMPELPQSKKLRYADDYKLSTDDIENIVVSFDKALFFEDLLTKTRSCLNSKPEIKIDTIAKTTANWLLGNISAHLNNNNLTFVDIDKSGINIDYLAKLLAMQIEGCINNNSSKKIFSEMLENNNTKTPAEIVLELGLGAMNNEDEIITLVDNAIVAQSKAVEEYKAGKEKALMSIVGAVMKASRGRANPARVKEILQDKLK